MEMHCIENVPHLLLFATRNIKVGEELAYDYGGQNLPWRIQSEIAMKSKNCIETKDKTKKKAQKKDKKKASMLPIHSCGEMDASMHAIDNSSKIVVTAELHLECYPRNPDVPVVHTQKVVPQVRRFLQRVTDDDFAIEVENAASSTVIITNKGGAEAESRCPKFSMLPSVTGEDTCTMTAGIDSEGTTTSEATMIAGIDSEGTTTSEATMIAGVDSEGTMTSEATMIAGIDSEGTMTSEATITARVDSEAKRTSEATMIAEIDSEGTMTSEATITAGVDSEATRTSDSTMIAGVDDSEATRSSEATMTAGVDSEATMIAGIDSEATRTSDSTMIAGVDSEATRTSEAMMIAGVVSEATMIAGIDSEGTMTRETTMIAVVDSEVTLISSGTMAAGIDSGAMRTTEAMMSAGIDSESTMTTERCSERTIFEGMVSEGTIITLADGEGMVFAGSDGEGLMMTESDGEGMIITDSDDKGMMLSGRDSDEVERQQLVMFRSILQPIENHQLATRRSYQKTITYSDCEDDSVLDPDWVPSSVTSENEVEPEEVEESSPKFASHSRLSRSSRTCKSTVLQKNLRPASPVIPINVIGGIGKGQAENHRMSLALPVTTIAEIDISSQDQDEVPNQSSSNVIPITVIEGIGQGKGKGQAENHHMSFTLPVTTIAGIDISSQDQDEVPNQSSSNVHNLSYKKPSRPCVYCGKMQTRLSRHIKARHPNEAAVAEASNLPKADQLNAFRALKRKGIYEANMNLLKRSKNPEYIRERKRGTASDIVVCMHCKCFIRKLYFSQHKLQCADLEGSCPLSLKAELLIQHEENPKFASDVLSRITNDSVGIICKSDPMILEVGRRQYEKLGRKPDKEMEVRKSTATGMRNLSKLFIAFQDAASKGGKSITSAEEMLDRSYFPFLETAVNQISSHEDGELKCGLKLSLGYIIKTACKVMKGTYLIKGNDEKSESINKFLAVLDLQWANVFGDAEYRAIKNRTTKLRKPVQLPIEDDILRLRNYVVDRINSMMSDEYLHWTSTEFSQLRDVVVVRLTLFNARRGGEPCRLYMSEWSDADANAWVNPAFADKLTDDVSLNLIDKYKVAFQAGKGSRRDVPVLIPADCTLAMRKLADQRFRASVGIHPENDFLFPSTQMSKNHVIGPVVMTNVCRLASVTRRITANQIRHRASTIFAGTNASQPTCEAFYNHMGHSAEMNRSVYQCPTAITEITAVGRYFDELDRGVYGGENARSLSAINESSSAPALSATSCNPDIHVDAEANGHAVVHSEGIDPVCAETTSCNEIEQQERQGLPESVNTSDVTTGKYLHILLPLGIYILDIYYSLVTCSHP